MVFAPSSLILTNYYLPLSEALGIQIKVLVLIQSLKSFLDSFFTKKKTNNVNDGKGENRTDYTPKEKELPKEIEQLHEPLLKELKQFKLVPRTKDKIIYHGSREFSPHTDYENRELLGDRKWLSDDQAYAVSYAFRDGHAELGRPLLWKCRFKKNIECLEGSQFNLVRHSPWGSGFPWQFPNNFHKYGKKIQGEQGSYVLLDHLENDQYGEILVALHNQLIEVVEVFVLPDDQDEATKYAATECV